MLRPLMSLRQPSKAELNSQAPQFGIAQNHVAPIHASRFGHNRLAPVGFIYSDRKFQPSKGPWAGFTSANAHGLSQREDEDFSVADLPGLSGRPDRFNDLVKH